MKKRIVQALMAALVISAPSAYWLLQLPPEKTETAADRCQEQGEQILWFITERPDGKKAKQKIKTCRIALQLTKHRLSKASVQLGSTDEALETIPKDLQKQKIIKICGTTKEAPKACPAWFPPEKRCAKCQHATLGEYWCNLGLPSRTIKDMSTCDPDAKGCTPMQCECGSGSCSDVQNEAASNESTDGGWVDVAMREGDAS